MKEEFKEGNYLHREHTIKMTREDVEDIIKQSLNMPEDATVSWTFKDNIFGEMTVTDTKTELVSNYNRNRHVKKVIMTYDGMINLSKFIADKKINLIDRRAYLCFEIFHHVSCVEASDDINYKLTKIYKATKSTTINLDTEVFGNKCTHEYTFKEGEYVVVYE